MDVRHICTRVDFEKARELILSFMGREVYCTRSQLSRFRVFGISYETIELAIRVLIRTGVIEELFVLPHRPESRGQRKEYYGLTVALDAHAIELPSGIVRESKALELIADLEEATA